MGQKRCKDHSEPQGSNHKPPIFHFITCLADRASGPTAYTGHHAVNDAQGRVRHSRSHTEQRPGRRGRLQISLGRVWTANPTRPYRAEEREEVKAVGEDGRLVFSQGAQGAQPLTLSMKWLPESTSANSDLSSRAWHSAVTFRLAPLR